MPKCRRHSRYGDFRETLKEKGKNYETLPFECPFFSSLNFRRASVIFWFRTSPLASRYDTVYRIYTRSKQRSSDPCFYCAFVIFRRRFIFPAHDTHRQFFSHSSARRGRFEVCTEDTRERRDSLTRENKDATSLVEQRVAEVYDAVRQRGSFRLAK